MLRRNRVQTVMGQRIPVPRVTIEGRLLALLYLGAPLMAALLLFDVVVWALFKLTLGWCVAVWCVF